MLEIKRKHVLNWSFTCSFNIRIQIQVILVTRAFAVHGIILVS
jgi:hypothetical protein